MWRVIKLEKRSGYLNQAIVAAIIELQKQDKSPKTLFFYQWEPSAVAIGNSQNIDKVCNIEECKELGIDIIRRNSGGGSVYLDSDNCFTYSIISKGLPKDIKQSYELICEKVAKVLDSFSIPAYFKKNTNDIFVNDKKISGSAQIVQGDSVMVGGTMLLDLNLDIMNKVLKYDKEKLLEKGITDPEDAVTSIKDYSNITKEELIEALTKELTNNDFYFGDLTEEEINLAKQLEIEKYQTQEWIFRNS